MGRTDRYHFLTEQQIDVLGLLSIAAGVCLALFTLAAGLAAGFGTTISASHAALSTRMLAVYAGLTIFALLATLGFGVLSYFAIYASVRQLRQMKAAPSTPLVEVPLAGLVQQVFGSADAATPIISPDPDGPNSPW